jgi:serine/threonine-protein kinase RsbT
VADESLFEESWAVDSPAAALAVRQRARELALALGFGARASEAVTIAVSELANNIVDHAKSGHILIRTVRDGTRVCVVIVAGDRGPGIADIDWALTDGCSSAGGLGCGLPAVRRLMDEFRIDSVVGRGTEITVRKWLAGPDAEGQRRPDENARS